MRESWWKKQSDLDDEQQTVIGLPQDGRYLILGPPGSGKTNLLLLRAMFLSSAGLKDVLLLTVGKTLQEFISTGTGTKGLIDPDQIMTFRMWVMKYLAEHSPQFMKHPPEGSYAETAPIYAAELLRVNAAKPAMYQAILVDEVQDLSAAELKGLSMATKRMMVAGDERQQIYEIGEGVSTALSLGFTKITLPYHYRIGHRICEAADLVLPPKTGEKPLIQTCNYNEKVFPSSKNLRCKGSFDEQLQDVITQIRVQLKAYPGETIGLLLPKNRYFDQVRGVLSASDISELVGYHESGSSRDFPEGKRVFVMTIHSAKGTEFRVLHILAAEDLRPPLATRNVVFTAFTRAKTSLNVYYTGKVSKYIDGAFAQSSAPKISELFS